MAKSKRKNKHVKRQKTPDLSRPRYNNVVSNGDEIRMILPHEALPILPDIKFVNGVPDFLSDKDVYRAKLLSSHQNHYDPDEIDHAMEIMYQKIHEILKNYEKILSNYIEIHKDIDKKLNAYTIAYPHDIIDFTDYNQDKFRIASHMIQDGDTSLLWSTDEYVEIIPSTYEKFIIHRKNFDIEKSEISYEIAYYVNIQLHSPDNMITMPIIFADITALIKKGKDLDMFKSEDESIKNTTIALYKMNAASILGDICEFVLNNINKYAHDTKDFDFYKSYIRLLANQYTEMYIPRTTNEEIALRNTENLIDQKISEMFDCIIITNQYIREKQLSTPVKNAEPELTYTFTNHDKKQEYKAPPEMKIRILNGIKISSMRRPQSLSKERIITYQLSEWGRKEHLRHLKSGKVVPVKAATVHRKCVDAKNLAKQTTQTRTHYVIKDDKND